MWIEYFFLHTHGRSDKHFHEFDESISQDDIKEYINAISDAIECHGAQWSIIDAPPVDYLQLLIEKRKLQIQQLEKDIKRYELLKKSKEN